MLKNNSLLSLVYGVLFLMILGVVFITFYQKTDSSLVFSYPNGEISFAGREILLGKNNFYNKERFDKEFIVASNNLYQFYLYVKRYPLYVPEIEVKLEKAGIPDDFKYLALAESALRDDVVSSAGAAGIWQFMPETGKDFGLRVDEYIDERYHFEKSTDAAIKYLGLLYERFGDWALVAAAYNRGENAISRALVAQGVDNYYDLYLNEETSRYVFRIIAIKYVMQSYFEKKGFIDHFVGGVYKKPNTKVIQVGEIKDLAVWAKENGYTYKDIRVLNRWIMQDSLPEGRWNITVLQN